MRILIIRHGDPDYEHDTLTEKGWREANLLADRLDGIDFKAIYVSPMGRAKDTAKPTLERIGKTAEVCDWLQEFPARIMRPDVTEHEMICWDWLPQDWTRFPEMYDKDNWMKNPLMENGHVGELYQDVVSHFDDLLAEHGYVRKGAMYHAAEPNTDTIAFFCHYGLGSVLISRLIDVSPMLLWHHVVLPPTSVTTFYSEERRPGTAIFRASGIGDTSHLAVGKEPISFSARFCETYEGDERHD